MSSSSLLGTLVVRIAAEMRQYKGDLDQAARDTEQAAARIEQSTGNAGTATGKLGEKMGALRQVAGAASGDLVGAAEGAATLGSGAGVAALGVGVLAAGLVVAGVAAYKGAQEQSAYEKALILSGNAAGTTAGQLADMASNIGKVVGTQHAAAGALAAMAGSGQVAAGNLQKFSQVAVEMERTVGQSVQDTAKQFAELGQEPVKASLKLNESMNYLTAATFAQIKAAQDLGDEQRAADIAQNAYADGMAKVAAQMEGNLGLIERGWRGVKDMAAKAWDAMLNIGRESTAAEKLDFINELIANAEKKASTINPNDPGAQARAARQLETLGAQAAALEAVTFQQREAAKAQGETAAANKAGIAAVDALTAANDRYADKQAKATKELDAYRESLKAIRALPPSKETDKLLDPATIAATEAAIQKRGETAVRSARAINSEAIELAKQEAILLRVAGVTKDYQEELTRLQVVRAKGLVTEGDYIKQVDELIAKQPMAKKLMDEQAKAENELTKETNALADAEIKRIMGLEKSVESMEKSNAALAAEVEMIGKSKEAQNAIEQARLSSTIAIKEQQLELKKNTEFLSFEEIALEADIKALKERQALQGKKFEATAQADAAKETLAGQVSMWNSINNAAQSTFVNIFEGGKNAFDKLKETLKSGLLALLYEMTVKKWIFQIFASVTGGGSGLAQAAGMGGGDLISGASNLNTLYGAGAQFFTGGTAGASTASMVAANAVGAVGGDSIGTLATLNGQWAGVAAGATSAAASAAQAAIAANVAMEAGTGVALASGTTAAAAGGAAAGGAGASGAAGLAAIPGVGWIALAVIAAYYLAQGGETRSGASYALDSNGKAIKTEGPSGGEIAGEQARGAIEATANGITQLMTDLGSTAKLSGFVAGLESSENGKGFAFAGGQIGGHDFGVTARSKVGNMRDLNPEEAMKAYAVELQRATIQAVQVAALGTAAGTAISSQVGTGVFNTVQSGMGDAGGDSVAVEIMRTQITQTMDEAARQAAEQASGIPEIIRNMLRDVDLAGMAPESVTALMNEINALVATNKAIAAIGESTAMKNLAGLSFDAANGLATLAGGLAKLTPLLDAAYPILYSEGERAAAAAGALAEQFTAIGVTMPDTVAGLRALIEGQDLNTVAGQAMAVALYALVPAFGSAAAAADSARQQMASALQNFGTSQEQRDFTVETIRQSLGNAGLSLTHEQIANASRQDARDLYLAQDPNGPIAAAILANQGAFAGITSSSSFTNPSSAGGGGGGGSSAGSSVDPWKSAADAIVDAIKDLKSTLLETGSDSFARIQAQFAIEVAQAKAGSLSAAQDLPALAKSLASAGERNSKTALEQALLVAGIIDTLGQVVGGPAKVATLNVPSFDVGTDYVPRDMLAMVHQGERITRRADNPAAGGGGNSDLAGALQGMATRLDKIETNTRNGAMHAEKTKNLLVYVTRDGKAMQTEAFV